MTCNCKEVSTISGFMLNGFSNSQISVTIILMHCCFGNTLQFSGFWLQNLKWGDYIFQFDLKREIIILKGQVLHKCFFSL